MKIFVFGAGASHSAHTKKLPKHKIPPVTRGIFQGCNQYDIHYAKEIGLSIHDLNEIEDDSANFYDPTGVNIEKWLTTRWEEAHVMKPGKHKHAQFSKLAKIAFYIWILFLRVSECVYKNEDNCRHTVYRTLLNKIHSKKEDFGIINFNYDLLLDLTFSDVFNVNFDTFDDYIKNDYLKPHGSVNWFTTETSKNLLLSKTDDFDVGLHMRVAMSKMYKRKMMDLDQHKVINPNDLNLYNILQIYRRLSYQLFYPLIILPIYKDSMVVEDQIIKRAHDMFKTAKEIYLVGYRATDETASKLFTYIPDGTAKIHIVNSERSSVEVAEYIQKKYPNKFRGMCIWNNGFKEFVHNYLEQGPYVRLESREKECYES
ncbi:hypothetical protein A2866_04445 [Candidatus Roizmanbacteria bacterium RIFCSPHIGHO2_01_FULL_39_8]|uniref:SIR2-like domain-containing protein n=2 Tax=Microgenomates group TaxID=1794810 RepID=A0A1F7GS63_9BACT|nr:MAG: hypothetical protein A3D77_00770 [Candidatus Gottesmanbacteria bacterium RIFCSPHIGHO2_02_FULL_39_11]OGK21685.1 MAG: hypothetical protein A2866_04445 [Candidatus Roizmanbacteria bacterium RIFCSPHIGHO2_01_FULL_39_8]